jgi:hypothetical protein
MIPRVSFTAELEGRPLKDSELKIQALKAAAENKNEKLEATELEIQELEGGFTCRIIKIPPAFIHNQPHENVDRFFLTEHYLVRKSWWAPNVATLPMPD